MFPVLLEFGGVEIRYYGVIVALSFLLASWVSMRQAAKKDLDPKLIQDFAFYALLAGIAGARLYFVLFSEPAYFLTHPFEIIAVWKGGLGVIGSLMGGLVAAVWFSRKHGISLLRLGDSLAPGIALGQTTGQFASLLNGDSYGSPTNLPWAITFANPRSMAPLNIPLHPVEIYEKSKKATQDRRSPFFRLTRRLRYGALCHGLFSRRSGNDRLGHSSSSAGRPRNDVDLAHRVFGT